MFFGTVMYLATIRDTSTDGIGSMYTVRSTDGLQDQQLDSVRYGMFPTEGITTLYDILGIDLTEITLEDLSTGLVDTTIVLTTAIATETTLEELKCIETISV